LLKMILDKVYYKHSLNNIVTLFLVVGGIWLLALSLGFYWMMSHYNRIAKVDKEGNIKNLVDKLIKLEDSNARGIEKLDAAIKQFEGESKAFIQNVGFVRFNPFSETGGDQSFSLALLDGKESGFVLTVLHARARTRLYVKPIKKGRSEIELSSEERKALQQAQKAS